MRGHIADVFGVPPERVTAIPNGIDPTDLQPSATCRGCARSTRRPGRSSSCWSAGSSTRRASRSRSTRSPRLIERLGGVRFLVAGTGTAEAELKAQAQRLGLMEHGTFVGWIGDDMLHSLYRIADLCVVPSLYEPFGLVALEAMASGCPCIVADTGGLREVVPGGGRVGLRFRSRDPRSLARMAERC